MREVQSDLGFSQLDEIDSIACTVRDHVLVTSCSLLQTEAWRWKTEVTKNSDLHL